MILAIANGLLALKSWRRFPALSLYMAWAVYSALSYDPWDLAHYTRVALVSDCLRLLMIFEAWWRAFGSFTLDQKALSVSYAYCIGYMGFRLSSGLPASHAPEILAHTGRICFVAGCAFGLLMLWWFMRLRLGEPKHLAWTCGYCFLTLPGTLGYWLSTRASWPLLAKFSAGALILYTLLWAWDQKWWMKVKNKYTVAMPAAAITRSATRWLILNLPPRISAVSLKRFESSFDRIRVVSK